MIGVSAHSSVSAAGLNKPEIINAYFCQSQSGIKNNHFIPSEYCAAINKTSELALSSLLKNHPKYQRLDKSVQLAILCADTLEKKLDINKKTGVNIGSSRGTTNSLENAHESFIKNGKAPFLTSPLTTMGNIATNVARHLQLNGPAFSHSITCSTAMQSLLNAYQWIKAGDITSFIVGGTEAPLTSFTISQMKALGIYKPDINDKYPSNPLSINNCHNNMVLGEGAACFLLEHKDSSKKNEFFAILDGVGYSMENAPSMTGITKEGMALSESMKMAISKSTTKDPIDLIILHAPGTKNGEVSEINAIKNVFTDHIPALYSNKWLIGHTLGASGALSLDLAIHCLNENRTPQLPYPNISPKPNAQVKKILINTIGFGGNAVSAIISHPSLFN
jgi:3-oxoacyl-(acyl-carrier-protein) synthase